MSHSEFMAGTSKWLAYSCSVLRCLIFETPVNSYEDFIPRFLLIAANISEKDTSKQITLKSGKHTPITCSMRPTAYLDTCNFYVHKTLLFISNVILIFC